jgi:hypothetical protein
MHRKMLNKVIFKPKMWDHLKAATLAKMHGGEQSAQQLFSHYLYTIKAQKEAKHHLLSDAEKASDSVHVNMMNNIHHVTSSKFFLSFILYSYLRYICNLTFLVFIYCKRFATYYIR